MTVIGTCDSCGREILAPKDTIVWVEDRAFHTDCHRRYLLRQMSDQLNARGDQPPRDAVPA